MSSLSTEQIENKVIELAIGLDLAGKTIDFRPGQLEAIVRIIENVMNGTKHTLLEAPTGSGKSIIGIIAAYALHKMLGKTSYMLVSDLSLYDQYEADMKSFNLPDVFGCIKGKENYICEKNGCNASQSICSLQGASVRGLSKYPYAYSCMSSCKYAQDYINATKAPVTLMTYQMYFVQRNYVEEEMFADSNKNFPARDLVICDECHKICDICQSHFAPKVSIKRPSWMSTLDKFMRRNSNELYRAALVRRISMSDGNELMSNVKDYERYVACYLGANDKIRKLFAKKPNLSKDERALLAAGNKARQEHCKLSDLLSFIGTGNSPDNVVKTCTPDDITLNFIYDNIMLERYFHSKSKAETLMSATIGSFKEYAKLAGLDMKSVDAVQLDSTFDFSKSPILFSSENKMSYNDKAASIVKIAEQVASICKDNSSVRGIIQTGSYDNAQMLMKLLPDDVAQRCLLYNGTAEKRQMIDEFIDRANDSDDNHILVGPTLIEGLNFPDDACRFQICIKVPYACLGSEYVRKKMEKVNGWYMYDVLNKICQGIGRGIRHEHDWCKTYILDGCISRLVPMLEHNNVLHGRFKKIC